MEADLLLARCSPKDMFMDAYTFETLTWYIKHIKLPKAERSFILLHLVWDLVLRTHFQGGDQAVARLYQNYPWLVTWRVTIPDASWSTPVIWPEPLEVDVSDLI